MVVIVCVFICYLSAGLHKKYWMSFSETWWEDREWTKAELLHD